MSVSEEAKKFLDSRDSMNEALDIIMKNPLVIYHSNCADGFSAAWVFHNVQERAEVTFDFHAGVYNKAPPDVKNRIVYLVDFSYKREVVKQMCEDAVEVILIDHHKTAIGDLDPLTDERSAEFVPNFSRYVDIERSGAMLAWDYWHNTKFGDDGEVDTYYIPGDHDYHAPPLLLDHIQDRDLWKFKLSGTREINANVFSHEYTFENWDQLMSSTGADLLKMTVAGAAIERKHHKDIKELLNVCTRYLDIGGFTVPVASLPYTLASDAAGQLASEYKNGSLFAACYYDTANDRVFSLRSGQGGIDVALVAEQYGGGGHKHASGFKVPRSHPLAMS
ncbi:MAG: phosphohydrolase [Candidatus Babeliales bacterium]